MNEPKHLILSVKAVGDTVNFNVNNFRLLGSSIPTMLEKNTGYEHVSITLPAEKQAALVFFKASRGNYVAFLKFRRKENGQAWAYLDEELIPPCEMVVNNEGVITIKTSGGEIVSTDEKPGAYKVTCDVMCQFLIRDTTEEGLLTEAVKLADEQSELEQLRAEIRARQSSEADWIHKHLRLEKQLRDKEDVLEYVFHIVHNSWSPFFSRISLIRKKLMSVPGLCGWATK